MTGGDETSGVSLGAQFLGAFNEIEGHFRDSLQCEERVSFKTMIGTYEQQYHLTTEQVRALQAWARLRNAISHDLYFDGRPIAEPAAQVVDEISKLRDLILSPPLLWDCLDRRSVSVTNPGTPIRTVLEMVRLHDYSQVPVYGDKRYVGLLTTNCIARWLADRLATSTLGDGEPVQAVMEFAEPHDRAMHIPKTITVAAAIDLLSQAGADGFRPAALIMTRSGKADESALAVVVDFDLPSLNTALSLPRRAK